MPLRFSEFECEVGWTGGGTHGVGPSVLEFRTESQGTRRLRSLAQTVGLPLWRRERRGTPERVPSGGRHRRTDVVPLPQRPASFVPGGGPLLSLHRVLRSRRGGPTPHPGPVPGPRKVRSQRSRRFTPVCVVTVLLTTRTGPGKSR